MLLATQLALFVARSGVHCELKYQHWPMNRTLVVVQQGCQWHTVPIYRISRPKRRTFFPEKFDLRLMR